MNVSTIYVYFTRSTTVVNTDWKYNLPVGWVKDGYGLVVSFADEEGFEDEDEDFFRNNDADHFMEDFNFIGPKKSENEAMALINETFTELLNKGFVLKYKIELIR
jgi:hypothetical protein